MSQSKYHPDEILTEAASALACDNNEQAESIYTSIIKKIRLAFNNSERDVAQELQRLAKNLEETRGVEDSLVFKQRTCAVMLMMSMAERHKGKALPAPVSAPPKASLPFMTLEYLLVPSKNFDRDLAFYRKLPNAELAWAIEKRGARTAALKLAFGPLMLISDQKQSSDIEPVFTVDNLQKTLETLKQTGVSPIGGPTETICGTAYVIQDPGGKRISIVQQDQAQAIDRSYRDSKNPLRIAGY